MEPHITQALKRIRHYQHHADPKVRQHYEMAQKAHEARDQKTTIHHLNKSIKAAEKSKYRAPFSESYKVGDIVVPTIGAHKGHPHTVMHVHSTGEVNIKPKGLHPKQVKYRMGAVTAQPHHLEPHTVKESATCPDCGCDPCKCKLKLAEDVSTIHKGSHDYVGKVNGKTYVVPHATYSSFEPGYKKPLPHSTVTSREHIAQHNKNLSSDEINKVHQHVQQLHKEEVEHVQEALQDACWKGYEAIGMKEKGGRKVPKCVPIKEQTPSGGFAGPETAGVTSGGDVSTKTVSGSDTAPKSNRKKEILKNAMKSAKDKQKQKLGKSKEFEKDPEYSPLVITQP